MSLERRFFDAQRNRIVSIRGSLRVFLSHRKISKDVWVGAGKAEKSRPAPELSASADGRDHQHLLAGQLSWKYGMGPRHAYV